MANDFFISYARQDNETNRIRSLELMIGKKVGNIFLKRKGVGKQFPTPLNSHGSPTGT